MDDGSHDGTPEEARAAGARVLERPENGGKGRALRDGLADLLARPFTHVAFVDADGQHDPDDLPALLAAARGGADFVIGSRLKDAVTMPAKNYWANTIGDKVLSRMTGLPVEDGQSGYRVIADGPSPAAPAPRGAVFHRERDPHQGGAAREEVRDRAREDDLRRALALPAVPRHVGHVLVVASITRRWIPTRHNRRVVSPILTVDVEDWFHVCGHPLYSDPATWAGREKRVDVGVERVLALLDGTGSSATFFVLGWIARQSPSLVRRIADAGHEIACHGDVHRRVFEMSLPEFREDLRASRDTLQEIVGKTRHVLSGARVVDAARRQSRVRGSRRGRFHARLLAHDRRRRWGSPRIRRAR